MIPAEIPIHDFRQDTPDSIAFRVLPLEYKIGYDVSVPHRHNYYEVFFFNEGGGWHDLDFESLPISNHSLHFVSPGQVHEVRRIAESSGFVILFSREFFYFSPGSRDFLFDHPLFHNNHPRPYLELSQPEWEKIWQLGEDIRNNWKGNARYKNDLIRARLHLLLLEAKELFAGRSMQSTDSVDDLFREFRSLLEDKFRTMHKVKEYARTLGVGEKPLNDAVKRGRGKTASEMIHDRIVLEAKRLLLHSDHSAKEIAHFLHFDDPSHFSKFFRKKVGRSPSSFREWTRVQHAND